MAADTKAIDAVFAAAESDGRTALFEHEFYGVLAAAGMRTPAYLFLPPGRRAEASDMARFHSPEVVLKVVSTLIQHKTDVGGVAFVAADAAALNARLEVMAAEVPGRYLSWLKERSPAEAEGLTVDAVAANLRGFLVCEKVDFEKIGFGTELLLGLRNTREFGPDRLSRRGRHRGRVPQRALEGRPGCFDGFGPPPVPRGDPVPFAPLAVFDKLVKPFRGRPAPLTPAVLAETMPRSSMLAAHYSPFADGDGYVIEEAEVNPFVMMGGALVPLDGLCRFSRVHVDVHDRPVDGHRQAAASGVGCRHRGFREDQPGPGHPAQHPQDGLRQSPASMWSSPAWPRSTAAAASRPWPTCPRRSTSSS